LILQDIVAGHGVAVIDPHGDLANDILDHIPSHRIEDVTYFNPADTEFPVGFNLLGSDDEALFGAIARGGSNINGMQNKTLRRFLPDKSSGQMSRLLKRIRVHGLIEKSPTPTSTT